MIALLALLGLGNLLIELFLVWFLIGEEPAPCPASRTVLEAARSERRLHDVTRQTFVTMTEAAERRGRAQQQ